AARDTPCTRYPFYFCLSAFATSIASPHYRIPFVPGFLLLVLFLRGRKKSPQYYARLQTTSTAAPSTATNEGHLALSEEGLLVGGRPRSVQGTINAGGRKSPACGVGFFAPP
ncbi:hypothetical protein B0H14DRAFT_3139136, partial [Mycena olivaceomarginata]